MHIDHITLHHLRMPLVAPFETSFGRITEREGILIVVHSEGLTGYGECVADHDPGYAYETALTAWHILRDFLAPAILGQTVADPADFQRRVAQVRGHPMAKAGLEMALWDLQGKREGRSLAELLGGTRTRVDVGVSVGLQASPAALVERVGRYLADGYRRVKIKIKPGRDVAEPCAEPTPISACRWMPTPRTRWRPPPCCNRLMTSASFSSNSHSPRMTCGITDLSRRASARPSAWTRASCPRAMRGRHWRWGPAGSSTSRRAGSEA